MVGAFMKYHSKKKKKQGQKDFVPLLENQCERSKVKIEIINKLEKILAKLFVLEVI
jgi:hypothetical protein